MLLMPPQEVLYQFTVFDPGYQTVNSSIRANPTFCRICSYIEQRNETGQQHDTLIWLQPSVPLFAKSKISFDFVNFVAG